MLGNVLVEQVNHCHPYQIWKKNIKNIKNILILWSITRVKTDEKAKREKSFADIEGTRLRFDIRLKDKFWVALT